MSLLIVASFNTQFAAASVVDRLLARGIARERLSLCVDESVGNSGASSSAPTSIISWVSHKGGRLGQRPRELRSPPYATAASRHGHSVVTIDPSSERQRDDILALLKTTGALSVVSVVSVEGHLVAENPLMSPSPDIRTVVDVSRAMAASRGVQPERTVVSATPQDLPGKLSRTARDLVWRDRVAAGQGDDTLPMP